MRRLRLDPRIVAGTAGFCTLVALGLGADAIPTPLGIRGTEATQPLKLEPFSGLPEPKGNTVERGGRVVVGTEGLAPPVPGITGGDGATVAILGDLAPVNGATDKYLKMAVDHLNLLRPDIVLTVGNLVPGMTRDGAKYVRDTQSVRQTLGGLTMPWYPCPGETDILSGTRQPEDRRFEALYQKYMGPLYYSIDTGDVHAIVLDSEEAGGGIGDEQLRWLRNDLSRVFMAARGTRRPPWIVVTVHRALWRLSGDAGASWRRVHDLLVEFNRRPVVTVEGADGGGVARGPRVAAVIAGGERAYAMDPPRDDIRYYAMGPTAAAPRAGEDAATAVRGLMLLKLDGDGTGVHPAIVELGGERMDGEGAVMPADVVTARERATIDAIAAWGNDVIGVDGAIDDAAPEKKPLTLRLNNPLKEPIDLTLRLASTSLLTTPSLRESANTMAEGFDLPWEFSTAHVIRHLDAGGKDSWPISFEAGDNTPPQLEAVVRWTDPRGRSQEVILKRRVPLVPAAKLVVTKSKGEDVWKSDAASGSCYAWDVRDDEPRKLSPTWQMAADDEKVYIKVRVPDRAKSYWPRMTIDDAWGGIASDAVSVAWAAGDASPETVRRIWVLPFAPKSPELWTNVGARNAQTPLLRLDPKSAIAATVHDSDGGYEVTLTLPRATVFGSATATRLNIAVHDNDQGARTWVRSWAKEDLGPTAWGRVEIADAPPTTTRAAIK